MGENGTGVPLEVCIGYVYRFDEQYLLATVSDNGHKSDLGSNFS